MPLFWRDVVIKQNAVTDALHWFKLFGPELHIRIVLIQSQARVLEHCQADRVPASPRNHRIGFFDRRKPMFCLESRWNELVEGHLLRSEFFQSRRQPLHVLTPIEVAIDEYVFRG